MLERGCLSGEARLRGFSRCRLHVVASALHALARCFQMLVVGRKPAGNCLAANGLLFSICTWTSRSCSISCCHMRFSAWRFWFAFCGFQRAMNHVVHETIFLRSVCPSI